MRLGAQHRDRAVMPDGAELFGGAQACERGADDRDP
jgi:hypothetical protein